MSADQPRGFKDLRDQYQSGELVVFAGAGVSQAAGLPGRRGLVEHMLAFARDYGLHPGQVTELKQLVEAGELIDALTEIELAVTSKAFGREVERALDDGRREPPELARAIAALDQLRGLITTNLDRLLQRALESRWPTHVRAVASLVQGRGWVFKVHGSLEDRSTWVLTRAQYDRAMYNDPLQQELVKALFWGCPLLFVGCSFDDPEFALVLERVRALAQGQPPRHFALIDAAELTPTKRRPLSAAGITAIPYEGDAGRIELLKALA